MSWFLYIIKCADGTLYTGVTTDIERRLREHNSGKGGKYTRTRTPVILVHSEVYQTRAKAMSREAQLKGWTKSEKKALIEKTYAGLGKLRHGTA